MSRLSGAWSVELPAGQVSKAPLMVKDGRLFAVTSQGTILALDPATGATLWTYRPDTPFSGNRGIGIGNGLLFAGQRDSSVIAVSQETGRLVWKFERPADLPPQGMSSAPAFGNGVVVAVVSSGDNFMRGRALGIDAATGKGLWTFEVIPGPGQPGHETWPQDSDIWKYGGGAIWTTPSVDAALGLVYLETGNAVPQWGGEVRPGDNLYNNSVVALDLKTGKIRWHFQLVHHDIWEHDVGTPLVLYDATIGGRPRQVLLAMRTDGVPFVARSRHRRSRCCRSRSARRNRTPSSRPRRRSPSPSAPTGWGPSASIRRCCRPGSWAGATSIRCAPRCRTCSCRT